MFIDIFGCHNWAGVGCGGVYVPGIQWAEARDVTNTLQGMDREFSRPKCQ